MKFLNSKIHTTSIILAQCSLDSRKRNAAQLFILHRVNNICVEFMEAISIFDIFKIGIGPSSSHTLGPWLAALDFRSSLPSGPISGMRVKLYGSLSKTGRGHATDKAVQLGLLGYDPETMVTCEIPRVLHELEQACSIDINGVSIPFSPGEDIVFSKDEHPSHPNTLSFTCISDSSEQHTTTYLSVGGGFIQKQGIAVSNTTISFPYPIQNCADLRRHLLSTGLSIAELVWLNELHIEPEASLLEHISGLYRAMEGSLLNGLKAKGTLPGRLGTNRRAGSLCAKFLGGAEFEDLNDLVALIGTSHQDFQQVNKWVSCFALAVSEENAAMGRIVTSPTNGAAGVIPAVLLYHRCFCEGHDSEAVRRFFCTAGEIGSVFKKGATISGAVGGCQAEIGVSSAMAAAGLTEILGGTAEQVLMAAEIAMEHHLGLTCDPIGGLVQVPCIERNAMGAMKAITATHLALETDPHDAKVDLDDVIHAMWDTARDMNKKYKETSEGGLASRVSLALPEC